MKENKTIEDKLKEMGVSNEQFLQDGVDLAKIFAGHYHNYFMIQVLWFLEIALERATDKTTNAGFIESFAKNILELKEIYDYQS